MEQSFIAWLKQRTVSLPQPPLGIGDDAAILPPTDLGAVVTTDSLCEGTHFLLEECGARMVGRKLAAVNLSDLASMAADPVALFLSLCLPREHATRLAPEIVEGVIELADRYRVSLAGGDTNVWNGPLVVHMTAVGKVTPFGSWQRKGAQVGDAIVVSGELGGSILGKHLHFEPRIALAQALRQRIKVHAAIDVSDGLTIDLQHIVAQSGCGACLNMDQIPISDSARQRAQTSGQSPLEHALSDGEDFELLMAVPRDELAQLPNSIDGVPLTVIGEFVSRTGLWTRDGSKWKQVPPKGYIHR